MWPKAAVVEMTLSVIIFILLANLELGFATCWLAGNHNRKNGNVEVWYSSVFLPNKVSPGLFRMRGVRGCHSGHPPGGETRVLTGSSSGESYKTTMVSVM